MKGEQLGPTVNAVMCDTLCHRTIKLQQQVLQVLNAGTKNTTAMSTDSISRNNALRMLFTLMNFHDRSTS
jgi:hypothetical protein